MPKSSPATEVARARPSTPVAPAGQRRAFSPRVPPNSAVLGYGPMLPLVLAALGAWFGPEELGPVALRLAIVWAALVLAFIGGVRRGFGFGVDQAHTPSEIASSTAYFAIGGLALVSPREDWALGSLIVGYVLAAALDRRAALLGNAPLHFARLRPPQLAIGVAALAALWAWLGFGGPR